MTKIDKLINHLYRKFKCTNQPQLIHIPTICKKLGISYNSPNNISNSIGALRRAKMIIEVGRLGEGTVYKFSDDAKFNFKNAGKSNKAKELMKAWINHGAKWSEKVYGSDFEPYNPSDFEYPDYDDDLDYEDETIIYAKDPNRR